MQQASIRILHVDDDANFADLTATVLEREDDRFTVETATSADEGLDIISDRPPDCVVSDYEMPGQTGIEFLQNVRDEWPELPFIILTGKGSEEVASEAIDNGVTDYLQKQTGTDQYTILANRITNAVNKAHAEQELDRTRRYYNQILEHASDYVMIVNEHAEVQYISPSVERVLGYTPDQLTGVDALETTHPDDLSAVSDAFSKLFEQPEQEHTVEFRARHADGSWRWLEVRGRNLLDNPVIGGVLVSVRDTTTRVEQQQELETERRFVQQALDSLTDLFYVIDTDGSLRQWNNTVSAVTGYTESEIERMRPVEFFPTEDHEPIAEAIERTLRDGQARVEADILTADGQRIPHEFTGARLTDRDGNTTGMVGVGRDITEHKEQERELKQATEQLRDQYRHLFEEAPIMAVQTRNEDGRPIIEDCNQLFADTLGYPRSDAVGEELGTFYTPESREVLLSEGGYERALSGEFSQERRDLVTAEGETVETILRATPRPEGENREFGTVAMYVNISERADLRRHKARLEQFASVISHDLRNPLTVATSRTELAARECDSDHLADVAEALSRMEALIDDLLTLARQGEAVGEREQTALTDVVSACWHNVETGNATITTDGQATLVADRSRLSEALENLFCNAIEHGGESVTVTVGVLGDESGFYVADDGPGIPEPDRGDVFDSGYTTSNDGTGLGLAITQRICAAHGWDITATESETGGARFEITGVESIE